MYVEAAFGIYAIIVLPLFLLLRLRQAIALAVFGGWLLLPVGVYPTNEPDALFPYWIIGSALPSQMLISKSAAVPLVVFCWSSIFGMADLKRWRPSYWDLPILLWCVTPLVWSYVGISQNPTASMAALYLTCSWGLLWFIGRVWFSDQAGQLFVVKTIAWSGMACLPFAVVEGMGVASFYELFYGFHPFRFDGHERYFGYRPIGFFEHGNQYGLWVAVAAIASIWLSGMSRNGKFSALYLIVALGCSAIAVASQSWGAIALAFGGLLVLTLWGNRFVVPIALLGILAVVAVAIVHISGVLPLDYIARNTKMGQELIDLFQDLGRRSFLWRLSQDYKSLELLHASPWFGWGSWDWWRSINTRPWGLLFLTIGQFGVIGAVFAFSSVVGVAAQGLWKCRVIAKGDVASVCVTMCCIVLMAIGDAILNSFIYFPAIMIAGGLVKWRE